MEVTDPRVTAQAKYRQHIRSIRPNCCPVKGGSRCGLDEVEIAFLEERQPYAFVMRPYADTCDDMEKAFKDILTRVEGVGYFVARHYANESTSAKREIAAIVARDVGFSGYGYCWIDRLALWAHFGVAELGELNANVLIEIGMMKAYGKPMIYTLDERLTPLEKVPFDLSGQLLVTYRNYDTLHDELTHKVEFVVESLRRRYLI